MIANVASLPQTPEWFDDLTEGVILVQANRVIALNWAARQLLEVSQQVSGSSLIAVLRDHRLEQAFLERVTVECETRGRIIQAIPIKDGLLLKDMTLERRAQENARELLAVLSHELRTPVSVIRSTFEALKENPPDKLRERFLQKAEHETDRLVRLLNDLTVDVKPPQYRRVLLKEVAERAVGLVQRTLAEHGISLRQDIKPLTVWADTDKLLQVLINLLENAAIHGPDNKTVFLGASVDEGQNFVSIYIQDEGEPLEESLIEQLFQPHSQGKNGKAKGTGLGLFIVRNIAERWGGKAWGRPLKAGNEFGITVPLKR